MSLGVTTYHVSDVLTHVKRQFGDESGAQITNADIITWINMGQKEIASLTKCIEKKAVTDVVSGQYEYALPAEGATDIVAIRYKGATLPGMSFQQFEANYQDSDPLRIQKTAPQVWTMWGSTITLWPTPDEATVGGLTVYFVGVPAVVSASGDFLTVPDIYYESLCFYVLAKAYELDEDFATASEYMDRFRQRLDVDTDREDSPEIHYPSITITDWD